MHLSSLDTARIILIISEVLDVDVSLTDSLDTVPQWDSLAQLSILAKLEDSFELKFTLSQLSGVGSVRGWISAVDECLSNK